jgi:hypothetical protein
MFETLIVFHAVIISRYPFRISMALFGPLNYLTLIPGGFRASARATPLYISSVVPCPMSLSLSQCGFRDQLKLSFLPIGNSRDYFRQLHLNQIQD